MTNLEMLAWGLQHIAENHGLLCEHESWKEDGEMCIYGGCNVPTLQDVKFLCEDCKLPSGYIESSSFGIDVFLPDGMYFGVDSEWANAQYQQPVHEFWRRMS